MARSVYPSNILTFLRHDPSDRTRSLPNQGLDSDASHLTSIAEELCHQYQNDDNLWQDSPFRWIRSRPSRQCRQLLLTHRTKVTTHRTQAKSRTMERRPIENIENANPHVDRTAMERSEQAINQLVTGPTSRPIERYHRCKPVMKPAADRSKLGLQVVL